jgi:NitT/TauT family transport system ATP-binding protein
MTGHTGETGAVDGRTGAPAVVRGLDVVFPNGVAALRAVDCALAPGELVALVGPSGCGKSTLLRALAGLYAPSAGTVRVADRPPEEARRDVAPIGVVFQQPRLLAWRTVARNVGLPLELSGLARSERAVRAAALLATVGLADFAGAYPHQLSGGMRMRVAVARALVHRPALLLMDEPFAALDELTRETLQEELLVLRARHRFTTLFVTHNVFEAVFLADRVLVMSARPGRIAAEVAVPFGPVRPAELRADPAFARLAGEVARHLRAGAARHAGGVG